MKLRVTLKDPDALYRSIHHATLDELRAIPVEHEHQRDILAHKYREAICKIIVDKWMDYGEYLEVEFDTDAGTAVVVERG